MKEKEIYNDNRDNTLNKNQRLITKEFEFEFENGVLINNIILLERKILNYYLKILDNSNLNLKKEIFDNIADGNSSLTIYNNENYQELKILSYDLECKKYLTYDDENSEFPLSKEDLQENFFYFSNKVFNILYFSNYFYNFTKFCCNL